MTADYLGPLVVDEEITSELRRRKRKDVYQTVRGASRRLIAEKVRLEEADGWRIVRRNAKSTRMARPKPADEQLEDEVWCLMAQMGFKELSRGREFKVTVGKNLPRRQIDVFAKDDEAVTIVECTHRSTPGRKNMASLIEKIKAIRPDVIKAIRRTYTHQRPKVRFAIATRNISWRPVDLDSCEEAQITVMDDGALDYYAALVQHLKHAARYQLLGHLLGGQKIDGLTKTVVATRGKMGGDTFYTFLIRPDELLRIAYVGHKASRDLEDVATYQRMLQAGRLRKIARYINAGGRFPTNIVVNLKTERRRGLRFDRIENTGDDTLGHLHLPPKYASAWIIDGQHRLYGYEYARRGGNDSFNRDTTTLSVLAYENLDAEKEMNLFIDINSKQVKVRTGLLVELYADLHWRSPEPEEAFQALLSRIASRLNSQGSSPLHERMVVTGKKKSHHRCLTQTSIRDGLKHAGLLGTLSSRSIVPGPLSTANADDYEANLRKALSVLSECLGQFATALPDHWQAGDGPGGYLCTNNGLRALFHVIKDVAEEVRRDEGTDLCLLDAHETVDALRPYLQALLDYLSDASTEEIQAFRRIGSSLAAVRDQAYGLEAEIHNRVPGFEPAGLRRYLKSRDEAGTKRAAAHIREIQRRLFEYVVGRLKEHFCSEEDAWWTEGVPLSIRQRCVQDREAKGREGRPESYLYLIDYVSICHANWNLVKDVISLGARNKDNKRQNTAWIKELNDLRNVTAHPERGVLREHQVARVNEIAAKVEIFFPEEL